MSLDQFKVIYWWEWTHRMLARSTGAVFLLPFLYFLWRGAIPPPLQRRLWLIFAGGAALGVVGWWMVSSGLSGTRVSVSQYRLAFHLTLGVRDLCRDRVDLAAGAAAQADCRRAARCATARCSSPCWCWRRSISARWSQASTPA